MEKQTRTIEDQREKEITAIEEHGKQLTKNDYNSKKYSPLELFLVKKKYLINLSLKRVVNETSGPINFSDLLVQ